MLRIVWTDYLQYRVKLRGFDIDKVETILRHGAERYLDKATGRMIAVGKHDSRLVLIAYDAAEENEITPVTIHATTRQQVNNRLKSGRFQL